MLFPEARHAFRHPDEPDQIVFAGVDGPSRKNKRGSVEPESELSRLIRTGPPRECAVALLEEYKTAFAKAPNNLPQIWLATPDKGLAYVYGRGGLSYAKVATWAGVWVRKTRSTRFALIGSAYAEVTEGAAVLLPEMRKRVIVFVAVDDVHHQGIFVSSQVQGDPDNGVVTGFDDRHRLNVRTYAYLVSDLLPRPGRKPVPAPPGDAA